MSRKFVRITQKFFNGTPGCTRMLCMHRLCQQWYVCRNRANLHVTCTCI